MARKPDAKVPKLIPRPNGHGALLSGGVPGNRGPGVLSHTVATASQIRGRLRQVLADDGVDLIQATIQGKRLRGAAGRALQLRAVEIAGKLGIGEAQVLVPDEALRALAQAVADHVADRELAKAILASAAAYLIAAS